MAMRVQGPGGAVIEFPDGTDEATIGRAMMQLGGQEAAPQAPPPPTEAPQYPSVMSQHMGDLALSGGGAALFGANDAQLADIYQKQLGDKFIGRENVSIPELPMAPGSQPGTRANAARTQGGDYPVIVSRGEDGKEQRGYVNQPGMDREDVARFGLGSLPYIATGAAGAAAAGGRGLVTQALAQAGAAGATSVAGDAALSPMGSEQGIDGKKALIAAVLGGAGPVVARGGQNATEYVGNALAPRPAELQQFGRNAVNRVDDLMQSDRVGAPQAWRAQAELGPEGMLADMGPNMQAATAVIARTPGEGKTRVVEALNQRTQGAGGRIAAELDDSMGPAMPTRQTERQLRDTYSQQARPLYDEFYSSEIPVDQELVSILHAVPDGIWPKVAEKIRMERLDPNTPLTSPRGIDLIKRALDDGAKGAGYGTDDFRLYSNLARDLRGHVDNLLSPDDPAMSPWARARAVSGEEKGAGEALEYGSNIFTRGKDPLDVAEELSTSSQLEAEMIRGAARNDLRGAMGRNSTAYGPNGDTKARKLLNSDFNRENTRLVAGDRAAGNIARRIDAETTFAETNDLAQRNSVTSTMEAAKKSVPGAQAVETDFASEIGKKGPSGLATEYAARLANMLTNGALTRRNERIRLDMARMLVAQGTPRDRIIGALLDLRGNRALSAERGAAVGRIIDALSLGTRGPAASALANE